MQWWQQFPALIGVVIGALGSYLTVTAGERARFRREQVVRWDERRIAAYGDYARALKGTMTALRRVSAHLGNDPHSHPLPWDEAAPALTAAFAERATAWEALLFFGRPDVVEAARRWLFAVNELERFAKEQIHNPDEWRAAFEAAQTARESFYEAARKDLAIPGSA